MKIDIEKLEFSSIIGILEHERKNAQRVIVNLSLYYEYKEGDFVDYAKVSDMIVSHMQESKYHLLEDALNGVSKQIQVHFPLVEKLQLKITKPDILKNCEVSLEEIYTFL